MRVLMISKACYVAAYRTKLEAIASLGVDLTLVVPPYWRFGDRRDPYEPGNDAGYRTIVANPWLNGNTHLHLYPDIGATIVATRPDLVHIDEEPYDLVTYLAQAAARRHGAKTIFFTWQNLDRSYPAPFEFLRSAVHRKADGAIAGNAEAAAILRRRDYLGPLATIPQFGVDPAAFPFQPPAGEGPLRIGYAGRLYAGKGVDVLIDALDADWRLDIVGVGEAEADLRQRAAPHGERVRFLPALPSRAMPAFFQSIDVLVLPSRTLPHWKEQFGRVLTEAMASGVPVIGSDSGEIPHVIGEAGLVVPEGDHAALRAALASLTPARRRSFSEAGRARVLAHFTQQRVAEATVDLYRTVLG